MIARIPAAFLAVVPSLAGLGSAIVA